MSSCCVVVIGHVDHGKTTLVRALTGIETDRLPEEKKRGLTIVPGFAHRAYAAGVIDFVDAPGHADFIAAMVAAASGAQAAMLVVSATEGVQQQTREHLTIAGMLGLRRGVVVVTKCDLVTAEEQPAILDDLHRVLADSALADAPVVLCDAATGRGLSEVHQALEALLEIPQNHAPPAFLPIDRVFSVAGKGTVVTGTLQGAALSVDDALVLYPAGQKTSLRGLQSRGTSVERIEPGSRMAANLRGVAVDEIARGSVLAPTGVGAASTCFDIALRPEIPIKHMQKLRVHWGTANAVAQLRLFGAGQMQPGASGFAQLRFRDPVIGFAGQAAILRQLSPAATIGGATILDPQARPTGSGDKARHEVLRAAAAQEVDALAKALIAAGNGAAETAEIERLSRGRVWRPEDYILLSDGLITDQEFVDDFAAQMLAAIARYHQAHPLHPFAPLNQLPLRKVAPALLKFVEARLVGQGKLRSDAGGLAVADHDPRAALSPEQTARMQEIERLFEAAFLSPPREDAIVSGPDDPDLILLLQHMGTLVSLPNVALNQQVVVHSKALDQAALRLAQAFADARPFTTSEARKVLETSRRVIVPVLEHFDRTGITTRDGSTRTIAEP